MPDDSAEIERRSLPLVVPGQHGQQSSQTDAGQGRAAACHETTVLALEAELSRQGGAQDDPSCRTMRLLRICDC